MLHRGIERDRGIAAYGGRAPTDRPDSCSGQWPQTPPAESARQRRDTTGRVWRTRRRTRNTRRRRRDTTSFPGVRARALSARAFPSAFPGETDPRPYRRQPVQQQITAPLYIRITYPVDSSPPSPVPSVHVLQSRRIDCPVVHGCRGCRVVRIYSSYI